MSLYQGYRPTSCAESPLVGRVHNERDSAYGSVSPAPYDAESFYEEHDLGMAHHAMQDNQAGPSSPRPTRSSYGFSPSPQSRYQPPQYRTSLNPAQHYGAMYGSPRSVAASSAPAQYPPYSEPRYFGQGVNPGQYPGAMSEPLPESPYLYQGPPSFHGHSTYEGHDMYYGGPLSPQLPPHDNPFNQEPAPELFGVSAPHHFPGLNYAPGHSSSTREFLPNFPAWSRTWYDGHLSANGHAYTLARPPSGVDGWQSETLSGSGHHSDKYMSVYGMRRGPQGMSDPVKEERMRMLEREFGKPKISHRDKGGDDSDDGDHEKGGTRDEYDDADVPIGGVTSRGKIVTERPKLDLALRWLIGLTALATFACGIGGAVLVKPGNSAPAARGSIPAYILYALSALSLAAITYMYVLRPCCCNPMRTELKASGGPANPLANMVIPVLSGGPQTKRGRMGRGKRGRMGAMQAAPVVNLIVDPVLLGGDSRKKKRRGAEPDSEDEDEDDERERLPGDARRSARRRNGLGVFGNMQLQRRWQLARKTLKVRTALDAVLFVAWIACSVIALGMGKACPPGAGNGWCNYFNAAIACGVIQAVWLLAALYLDYRGLSVSKAPPRPPM